MIQKVIHYCWFGGNPLPNDVKNCIKSWKKYAPDYEIKEWNETNFDVTCHPFIDSAYKVKAWAFVSDYARLKIIYENGGIYFDTDVELLKKLDFLLENDFYIGVQQGVFLCTTGLGFGATKSNLTVKRMMDKYYGLKFSLEDKEKIACPYLNAKVLEEAGYKYVDEVWRKGNITVYPCRYFDPLSPGDNKNLLCDETVSIHHYAASWTTGKNKLKRKLFRMIGDENIYKLKKILRK